MPYFLLSVCGFILMMVAVGLIRILRGPTNAERMMATQLFGTGGIAALLLLAAAAGLRGLSHSYASVSGAKYVPLNGKPASRNAADRPG